MRGSMSLLAMWLLVSATAAAGSAAAPPVVTAEDYARAERFLFWNRDRYLINGDIQQHWIGNQDRFWYQRTNDNGAKEFVVVNAADGTRHPAFEHAKIAAALSDLTHKPVEPGALPFSNFKYVDDEHAIQFDIADVQWTCQVKMAVCARAPSTAAGKEEAPSPDGKRVAFTRAHNLWVRERSSGHERALTSDGAENYGYATDSGTAAGVYRQRHGSGKPELLWSPDSKSIFTYRVDERRVKDLYLVESTPEDGSLRPKSYHYRVAEPGDPEVAQIQPVIIDVASGQTTVIDAPPLSVLAELLNYHHNAWWSADLRKVYEIRSDRFARSIGLEELDAQTGKVRQILRETAKVSLRITNDNTTFLGSPAVRTLANGDVIWFSERNGSAHLYYYDGATGKLRNQITKGPWVVRSIVRVDETKKLLYFTASGREKGAEPYQQYLYRIRLDGSDMRLLTPETADHLGGGAPESFAESGLPTVETGRLSPSGRYFIDNYSRPDLPPVFVVRTVDGRLVKQLERADISKLREGGYTPIEPFQAVAADGQTAIYGNMFRPSTFSPNKKYPVIDAVYPGPSVIRTQKSFSLATFDVMEAQSLAELGFIVVTVDGRGTAFRAREFSDYSYGHLEKASDLDDHIAALHQLANRYPYMDLDRVGVDGHSGGGYAATHAILAYPDFYKVAVSASGNQDQRILYAHWGEMYIGPLASMDESRYLAAANTPLAKNLKGKLLLAHGEMDDNDPPAMTFKLVDALIRENKDFDMLIIPNVNHLTRLSGYFIRRKWDYFVRNLLGAEPPVSYRLDEPEQIKKLIN
jgi:dipeptidyl-peptidase-4